MGSDLFFYIVRQVPQRAATEFIQSKMKTFTEKKLVFINRKIRKSTAKMWISRDCILKIHFAAALDIDFTCFYTLQ